jgi:2-polyprenyl-6-methoxyphenol hydroxylase-like FAD-dependent oxidoreductase
MSGAARGAAPPGKVDAVVAGGGPAGCATALTLRRAGRSVLLVERSGYDAWRPGEVLDPEVRRPLAELGLWERFARAGHAPSHAVLSAWGGPAPRERHRLFHPYGHGWHVDRAALDAMLADAAEAAGVTVLRGTRTAGTARDPDGWRVALRGRGGRRAEVTAAVLADATGRAATLARSQGAVRLAWDRLVGLVGVLPPAAATADARPPAAPDEPSLLIEATEQGWWYCAPLPGGWLVAAYLTDADLLRGSGLRPGELWHRRLGDAPAVAARVGGRPHGPLAVRVRRADSGRLHHAAGPGWLAVGDAAAAHDPLAATGVRRALDDGIGAGRALLDHLDGDQAALDRHAGRTAAAFDTYLAQRAAVYGLEARWPAGRFWRRRRPPPARLGVTPHPLTEVRLPLPDGRDPAAEAASDSLESLLPLADVRLLRRLCRGPARAHEVAAAFRAQARTRPSDAQVMLALQTLLSDRDATGREGRVVVPPDPRAGTGR